MCRKLVRVTSGVEMQNELNDDRRGLDRRVGDRRHKHGGKVDLSLLRGLQHIPTWEDQRSQYLTRLLFCGWPASWRQDA